MSPHEEPKFKLGSHFGLKFELGVFFLAVGTIKANNSLNVHEESELKFKSHFRLKLEFESFFLFANTTELLLVQIIC